LRERQKSKRSASRSRISSDMAKICLVNVGFGNIVSANRIVSLCTPDSSPTKRMIQEARERDMLVDASHGRRTKAVLVMDSMHVVLSALSTETIASRIENCSRED